MILLYRWFVFYPCYFQHLCIFYVTFEFLQGPVSNFLISLFSYFNNDNHIMELMKLEFLTLYLRRLEMISQSGVHCI